jgi:thiol-disulfide isomerase/thioredoxin
MAQNVVSAIYNDLIKPYKKIITIFVLSVIFIIASYYAYKWYAKPVFEEAFEESFEDLANRNERKGEAIVYFFHANWCPHCKKAQPEWNKFKSSVNGTTKKNYEIKCVTVDCTEGNDPRIQKYSVNGYPTVIMEKDAKTINLDSKITNDTLQQFIDKML